MKRTFLFFPIILWSCAEDAVTQLPIVKVRAPLEAATALSSSIPTSPGSLEVSLETLPDQVRQSNLSLAAARRLVAEARGKLKRSGVASNPELEVGFETNPRFHDFMLTVGISKKYPRTNRLLIEKKVSKILIQAAQAEIRDAERLLVGQARSSLVEVLALRQKWTLLVAQEANARELTKFTEEAAAKGEASPLDAGIALLEVIKLSNQAREIEIKETLAITKLKPLFGMKPKGELTVVGALPEPEMPMMNVTSYRRPDLEAARLRAKSATTAVDLARSKRLDDIETGIFAGVGRERDKPEGFEPEQILGVRFKIPLGENLSAIGETIEAEARADRLAIGTMALERMINAEAHAAHAEMKEWQILAGQIKSRLIPLANTHIEKMKEARTKGQVALRDVLLAKEQKLGLETSYLEAVRDFHLAYANYLTATAQ
ncbi:MAG: TolC family protein [Akkermansiaceae bacterium]|jgi:cobalt-zinc-cadmium efflux system outer membrane protein|tara:strand:+ start:3340 stop:4635 length:1296 start_codon:yes stop_codon:yes gene_type:complete